MTAKKHGVEIYDTTLRDGAQMNGISFSVADKLAIIKNLDELGIDFIEAGYPGSNEKDRQLFERAENLNLQHASLVAFGTTCHKGKSPKDDADLAILAKAGTEIVTLVGKSSRFQVCEVLKTDAGENIRMIRESCAWLVKNGKQVFFDAEHLFDGYKEDPDYALATLHAAADGGAIRIILCDTNGGTLCSEIGHIVGHVKRDTETSLGIHAHNDIGMAVANSIVAVEHGAIQVHGTVNGYGERCGNANILTVIATLQLKKDYPGLSAEQVAMLTKTSRFVAEIANLAPNPLQPYTGANAFCHKGGLHADGHRKHPESYQHIDPKLVGNHSDISVSGLAGKANIKLKSGKFGIELSPGETEKILSAVKNMETQGFQFEGADASLEILMERMKDGYSAPFEILTRRVQSEKKRGKNPRDEAMVIMRVNNHTRGRISCQVAFSKDGPIDALDKAIRKALKPQHARSIRNIRLVDYKVRPINSAKGTRSSVRVLIDFSDGEKNWTTVGVSVDEIEASCQALIDGFEYSILKAR